MNFLAPYLRAISIALSSLIISQSCTVYHTSHYTASETARFEKAKIKVKTHSGKKHILPWVEERGDQIYSVKNSRIKYLSRSNFVTMSLDQTEHFSKIDRPMDIEGYILLVTSDPKNSRKYYNHEFFRVVCAGSSIKGYEAVTADTTSIYIPKKDIKFIKVEDRTGSTLASTGIFFLVFLGISAIIIASQADNMFSGMTFTK